MPTEPQSPDAQFSDVQLQDHHGELVSLQSYRGRCVLLFFGFTHCRVVCPRKLAQLSSLLSELGPLADHVTPLYVTVDPARDTPNRMRDFLSGHAPAFVGLTGSSAAIERLKSTFQVHARKARDPGDPNGYAVPHTAITYVLGTDGELLDHFLDGTTNDQMLKRLTQVIQQPVGP